MNQIKQSIESIQQNIVDISELVASVTSMQQVEATAKIPYKTSRDIRKLAQSNKHESQNIRLIMSEIMKKQKNG